MPRDRLPDLTARALVGAPSVQPGTGPLVHQPYLWNTYWVVGAGQAARRGRGNTVEDVIPITKTQLKGQVRHPSTRSFYHKVLSPAMKTTAQATIK